jgi:cytoskeletal protein CcmA (bactofilin family)
MSKWGIKEIKDIPSSEISTLLGKDAEVKGSIKSQGSMRIDGSVDGELASTKTITIGTSGSVEGNITAENIIISGRVRGSLSARGKIILESTARLEGDITASRLAIAEGASFRGRSNTGEPTRTTNPAEARDMRIVTPSVPQDKSAVA